MVNSYNVGDRLNSTADLVRAVASGCEVRDMDGDTARASDDGESLVYAWHIDRRGIGIRIADLAADLFPFEVSKTPDGAEAARESK